MPALTFLGSLSGYVLTASQLGLHGFDMARVLGAAAITSFYSVPTYIGVVAIGQALAYFARVQARDRLLAPPNCARWRRSSIRISCSTR